MVLIAPCIFTRYSIYVSRSHMHACGYSVQKENVNERHKRMSAKSEVEEKKSTTNVTTTSFTSDCSQWTMKEDENDYNECGDGNGYGNEEEEEEGEEVQQHTLKRERKNPHLNHFGLTFRVQYKTVVHLFHFVLVLYYNRSVRSRFVFLLRSKYERNSILLVNFLRFRFSHREKEREW